MNYTRPDSQIKGYTAHVAADDPAYKSQVAEPVMRAIDGMPASYRRLVHEYGYIDGYRAWKRGWSVEKIRAHVRNGVFALNA